MNCDQMNNPRNMIEKTKLISCLILFAANKRDWLPDIKAAKTTKEEIAPTIKRMSVR